MKKNLLLLAACIVLVAGTFGSLSAQTFTTGHDYDFSVTPSSATGTFSYSWEIYNAANTAPAGAVATVTDGTTESPTFNFTTAGTYTIRVTETRNGCQDLTPSTLAITVISTIPVISIAQADNAGCDGSSDIALSFTDIAAVHYPVTIQYTLDGVAQTPYVLNSGTTMTLTFANTTSPAVDDDQEIIITGATDDAGLTLDVDADLADRNYTRTVYYTPATSAISHE